MRQHLKSLWPNAVMFNYRCMILTTHYPIAGIAGIVGDAFV